MALAVTAAMWHVIGDARADEIRAAGQTYQRVAISNYDQGVLEFRKLGGVIERRRIWEVARLTMEQDSRFSDFNEAERYLDGDEPAQAITRYERALRQARGFWPDLIYARLLTAADRAGEYDKAVRLFLKMAASDPMAAAHLLPRPAGNDRETGRALRRINSFLDDVRAEPSGLLARILLCQHQQVTGASENVPSCATVATADIAEALMSPRVIRVQLKAIRTVADEGETSSVVGPLDRVLARAPSAMLPEILLLKSEVLLAIAGTEDEYLTAALPAMRAAIHYSGTPHEEHGLLLAAKALESAGKRADAVRLLRTCLVRDNASEQAKQTARQRLARLTMSDS